MAPVRGNVFSESMRLAAAIPSRRVHQRCWYQPVPQWTLALRFRQQCSQPEQSKQAPSARRDSVSFEVVLSHSEAGPAATPLANTRGWKGRTGQKVQTRVLYLHTPRSTELEQRPLGMIPGNLKEFHSPLRSYKVLRNSVFVCVLAQATPNSQDVTLLLLFLPYSRPIGGKAASAGSKLPAS